MEGAAAVVVTRKRRRSQSNNIPPLLTKDGSSLVTSDGPQPFTDHVVVESTAGDHETCVSSWWPPPVPSTTSRPAQEDAIVPTPNNIISTEQHQQQPPPLPPSNQPSTKKKKKPAADPAVRAFRRTIQECCKRNDLATAMQSYQQAREKQILIESSTLIHLLSLCDGLGDRGIHIGTPNGPPRRCPAAEPPNQGTSSSSSTTTGDRTATTNPSNRTGNDAHRSIPDGQDPETTLTEGESTVLEDVIQDDHEVDVRVRLEYAQQIKRYMDEHQIPLTETAWTAWIRLWVKNGHYAAAEQALDQAESVQQCQPRLRLYAPLLAAYARPTASSVARPSASWEPLHAALRIWQKLSRQKLTCSERELAALITCCTRTLASSGPGGGGGADDVNGVVDHCADATEPHGSRIDSTLGRNDRRMHQTVTAVLERVLSDLADQVPVPSRDTGEALIEWFRSPGAVLKPDPLAQAPPSDAPQPELNLGEGNCILELLDSIPQANFVENMGPVVVEKLADLDEEAPGWEISTPCSVDVSTGILQTGCLAGGRLQPVRLSEEAWQHMIQLNQNIVLNGKLEEDTSPFQGGRKGPKRSVLNTAERVHHWQAFEEYLRIRCGTTATRQRPGLDVVIDGANVGFYQQNFAGAPKHVDYHQIDWVVQHFLRQGQKVLLILHARHFSPHLLPRRMEPVVRSWQESRVLYRTPLGMNDDWFWLHAALVSGPGTLVVTNDEMRDHHFQMLAPQTFLRWKDRHQVYFSFGSWIRGSSPGGRTVQLKYPEPYSRRIQRVLDGLVIPLPKQGDEHRFLDGSFVASCDAPAEETYLCIRPQPKKVSGSATSNELGSSARVYIER